MSRIVNEMLRRYALASVGRVVAEDFNHRGVDFKEGDRIPLPTLLHGLDGNLHDEALTVDFERRMNGNLAFGAGIHTSLGNALARMELAIFLKEWLDRIPDFTIDPVKPLRILSGSVCSLEQLWIHWDARH